MLIYLALASLMGLLFIRLPTAYLPDEDQGYLFTLVQTPVGATLAAHRQGARSDRGTISSTTRRTRSIRSLPLPASASTARARTTAWASCC